MPMAGERNAPGQCESSHKKYLEIVRHYERCLQKYGDSHLGVDWPKAQDVNTRHRIMLGVIRGHPGIPVHVLDFGCGASHLYEYILGNNLTHIVYSGLDLSEEFVAISRKKFPTVRYYCTDVLDDHAQLPNFDYVVMNGLFTVKATLSFDEMLAFFKAVIVSTFRLATIGMAFNVMSKHVDWERDDLFHLPFDVLAQFLTTSVTRKFVIRNDYGLYEYTTYIYK